jgi:hypothetical protein
VRLREASLRLLFATRNGSSSLYLAFRSDLGACCGPCGTNEKGWIYIDGSLHFTALRDLLLSLFRCITEQILFKLSRHPYIVDIFGEFACRPFLFAIQFREVECADRMAVEGGIVSVDYRVVAVDPHCCGDARTLPLSVRRF